MPRNKGILNGFLNFIGLVEDDPGTYGDEYQNGNYNRQASRPTNDARSRQSQQRRPQTEQRRNAAPGSRRSTSYDDYAPGERRSRFDDSAETGRTSRFDEPPRETREAREPRENRREAAEPPRTQETRMRVRNRSRTVMFSLTQLEDCCDVIDQLIANNTVVLTMQGMDGSTLQRAVDTLSGAVYALNASICKASDKTYLVAPKSVEVNGDIDRDHSFR